MCFVLVMLYPSPLLEGKYLSFQHTDATGSGKGRTVPDSCSSSVISCSGTVAYLIYSPPYKSSVTRVTMACGDGRASGFSTLLGTTLGCRTMGKMSPASCFLDSTADAFEVEPAWVCCHYRLLECLKLQDQRLGRVVSVTLVLVILDCPAVETHFGVWSGIFVAGVGSEARDVDTKTGSRTIAAVKARDGGRERRTAQKGRASKRSSSAEGGRATITWLALAPCDERVVVVVTKEKRRQGRRCRTNRL